MADLIKIPQIIDMHVHLREPGATYKEDIFSGTRAALFGGVTTVVDMPNNAVPITTAELLDEKIKLVKKNSVSNIGLYFGSKPEEPNYEEFSKVADKVLGLKLYFDVTTGNVKEHSAEAFKPIIAAWHAVNPRKVIVFHAEGRVIEDALKIVEDIKHPVHIAHCSNEVELTAVIKAKKKGLPVTCGVCPHHLFLDQSDEKKHGWRARMKPRLGTKKDVKFLWDNLDYIDVFETDHAPHTLEEKSKASEENPVFGIPGVETLMPLLLKAVKDKKLSMSQLIERVSTNPARILGIKIDVDTFTEFEPKTYKISDSQIQSKAGWTPFAGEQGYGKVHRVVIEGRTVYKDGKLRQVRGDGRFLEPLEVFQKSNAPTRSQGALDYLKGEWAKDVLDKEIAALGKMRLGRNILNGLSGGRVKSKKLNTEIAGIKLESPVMVAAGWDKKGTSLDGLSALGFSGVEVGTVLDRPQKGSPRPRLWRAQMGSVTLNRMGLNSIGVDQVTENLVKASANVVVGISVGKNNDVENSDAPEVHASLVEQTYELGDYFVINVASPNTPGLRQMLKKKPMEDNIKAVLKAMGDAGGKKPLFIKTTVDSQIMEIDDIIDLALKYKIAGIIGSNTTNNNDLKYRYGWSERSGGLSGDDERYRHMALERARYIHQRSQGKLCFIGAGGIMNGQHAYDRIAAGASAVQVYSAILNRKFKAAIGINRELLDIMNAEGIKSVSELIGRDA